jgi:hypothetical protein
MSAMGCQIHGRFQGVIRTLSRRRSRATEFDPERSFLLDVLLFSSLEGLFSLVSQVLAWIPIKVTSPSSFGVMLKSLRQSVVVFIELERP